MLFFARARFRVPSMEVGLEDGDADSPNAPSQQAVLLLYQSVVVVYTPSVLLLWRIRGVRRRRAIVQSRPWRDWEAVQPFPPIPPHTPPCREGLAGLCVLACILSSEELRCFWRRSCLPSALTDWLGNIAPILIQSPIAGYAI